MLGPGPHMRASIRLFLITLLLGMLLKPADAQFRRRTPTLAFGLQVVQPLGQYKQLYDGVPSGLTGNFAAPVARSPFELGLALAWSSMGSQNEDVEVYVGDDESGNKIVSPGTLRIRSNNYRYLFLARFRPFAGAVQIYGDVMLGAESFLTKTDIQFDNQGYSQVSDSQVQHRDFTFNLGWALGARVRLTPGIFLDARLEKLEGGQARYVDDQTIQVNTSDNSLNYEVRESQTDKYTYQLGIAFQF